MDYGPRKDPSLVKNAMMTELEEDHNRTGTDVYLGLDRNCTFFWSCYHNMIHMVNWPIIWSTVDNIEIEFTNVQNYLNIELEDNCFSGDKPSRKSVQESYAIFRQATLMPILQALRG